MKFKGTEDRKKRILNNRRAALENDVSWLIIQLIISSRLEARSITELSSCYSHFSDMKSEHNDHRLSHS